MVDALTADGLLRLMRRDPFGSPATQRLYEIEKLLTRYRFGDQDLGLMRNEILTQNSLVGEEDMA